METMRRIGWWCLLFMAVGVSGYALAFLATEGFGSDFAKHIVSQQTAFVGHMLGGAVALTLGVFQLSARLRQKQPKVHRWIGSIYLTAVLIGGISGMALAFNAYGDWVTKAGFGMLAVAWLVTGTLAYQRIRNGLVQQHRYWMLLNFSLTAAAITLRLMIPSFLMSGVSFDVAYPIISWLCWTVNLAVMLVYLHFWPRRQGSPVPA